MEFSEIDRAEFFGLGTARKKIKFGQEKFIEELAAILGSNKKNSPNLPIERVQFYFLKVIVPIHAVKTGTNSGSTS